MTAPTITPMSDEDLAELEKLALSSQKGPWRPGPYSSDIWGPSAKGGETKIADIRGWGYLTGKGSGALGLPDKEAVAIQTANCAFIAASRDGITALIARTKVAEAALSSSRAEVETLRAALDRLVNSKALCGVRELVAGWNGESRPEPFKERHPKGLGATLPKTNCGAVYDLDEAMQAVRSTLASSEKDHG